MKVRRCDACGAIGKAPYEGWLRIETFAREEDPDRQGLRLYGTPTRPVLTYEVCGHGCLPELAFQKSSSFVAGREFAT